MKRKILLAAVIVSAMALGGCGGNESRDSTLESSLDMPEAEAPKNDIILKSEFEYQQRMGNTVEGRSSSPDLFRKELGTSVGSTITIPEFFIWSSDSSEWERGGKLQIFNDDSMGSEFRIACALSPEQGDKIMKNKVRRELDITGTISSYSSSDGLLIDPCTITRDELDSPKKSKAIDYNENKHDAPINSGEDHNDETKNMSAGSSDDTSALDEGNNDDYEAYAIEQNH